MRSCNCSGCFIKTVAFITALLSITVLLFSSIILISSVTYTNHKGDDDGSNAAENDSISATLPPEKVNDIDENANITAKSLTNVYQENATEPGIDSIGESKDQSTPKPVSPEQSILTNTSASTDNIEEQSNPSTSTTESSKLEPSWKTFFESHQDFWESKTNTYAIIMQASSGTGIFAAVLQLGFSWLLICSSNKDLKERTKLWTLSNFIVLILLVVLILLPLSYNSSTDTFKGTMAFGKEIARKIVSPEFYSKTVQGIPNSIPNFLQKDLALYYYVMALDTLALLTFLIPPLLCCCLYPCKKCCCSGKRNEKSGSDIMLFGPSNGSGGEWN